MKGDKNRFGVGELDRYMGSPGVDDSLEEVEMLRSGGVVNPVGMVGGNTYQLTFKKNQGESYFMGSGRDSLGSSCQQLLKVLRHPLEYYQQMGINELSSLPFADLYSLQLSDHDRDKLVLIGQILQLKRMRGKGRSVGLNLRCLTLRENLSYEQKNKVFVMGLLEKQLMKKSFIGALRVNFMRERYLRLYGDWEEEEVRRNPEKIEPQRVSEQLFQDQEDEDEEEMGVEEERQWKQERHWSQQQQNSGEGDSKIEDQLLIFIQIVSTIERRQLFSAFNTVANHCNQPKITPTSHDISPIPTHKRPMVSSPKVLSNHLIHLQPSIEGQNEEEQEEEMAEHVQGRISDIEEGYSKLDELYVIMEELHEECAGSDDLVRKYFIKWKIYLLQAIAQSLITQIRNQEEEGQGGYEEDGDEEERYGDGDEESEVQRGFYSGERGGRLTHEEREYSQGLMDNGERDNDVVEWSRNTTQMSQNQTTLKAEKRELKDYLFHQHSRKLLQNLYSFKQQKMIQTFAAKVHRVKTLKNVLDRLIFNSQEEQRMKNMQGYYQQIAEDQDEEHEGTAYFFWKTNLLHRYFKRMRENRRNGVMGRILEDLCVKLAFRTVRIFCWEGKRTFEVLERWKQHRARKLVFKCFSGWKYQHRRSCSHFKEVKMFMLRREQQLAKTCFSILKLGYKRGLIKMLKAERYYAAVTKSRIFNAVRDVTDEGRQFRQKEYSLRQYLIFRRGSTFIQKFTNFYQEYLSYQRFTVKQQKLRRTLLGLHALKGVKRWRGRHMRKVVYETIEYKLKKVNQKQKKREIFKIWIDRTFNGEEMGSGSDRHKQWLVQYYSGLCSVMP